MRCLVVEGGRRVVDRGRGLGRSSTRQEGAVVDSPRVVERALETTRARASIFEAILSSMQRGAFRVIDVGNSRRQARDC